MFGPYSVDLMGTTTQTVLYKIKKVFLSASLKTKVKKYKVGTYISHPVWISMETLRLLVWTKDCIVVTQTGITIHSHVSHSFPFFRRRR